MTKEIAVKQDHSPVSFVTLAIAKGFDVEQIEKMLELQAKYDAIEAKKSYTNAMAEFKTIPLVVTKDKENSQYKSMYTTLGNLINTALPAMSKSGLSHKWDIEQGEKTIKVTCIVTHSMGHSESTTLIAPPDTSGSKNSIQQLKSTITYLKSVTFESAMGLASSDANMDDDGNKAGLEFITKEQVKIITDMIKVKNIDANVVLQSLECETIDTITANKYKPLVSRLKATEIKK